MQVMGPGYEREYGACCLSSSVMDLFACLEGGEAHKIYTALSE